MNILQPTLWVKLYADYLLQYAMFRLNDIALCEDLVQETFLSALKAKEKYRGESSEKTWLVSILKNKIIDSYKKKNILQNSENNYINEDYINNYFDNAETSQGHWNQKQMPRDFTPNIEDKIIGQEYIDTLRECLSKLTQTHKILLQEKYVDNNSSDQICKVLNISKSNYWVIMHRINLQLRKCIELKWFSR